MRSSPQQHRGRIPFASVIILFLIWEIFMKRLKLYMILGFLFTAVLGTVWHFLYDWTGRGAIAALFFPVNESTWEHMKLIFFPMLLSSFFLSARFKEEYPCLPGALLLGDLLGTLSIPVTFYTYKGIVGRSFLAADIAVFLAGVLIAFRTAWVLKESPAVCQYRNLIYLFTVLSAVLFFIFAFLPPAIGLFAEP